MATESNQLLGQVLGTCTLQRLLGRGGMGAVYLAQQSRPRRSVAVKVLMPGLFLETKVRKEFLLRFRREADAIAALDHINIMPIHEYGEQGDMAYLVMPHITGGTLRDLLARRGRLPLDETVAIIEQAAAALDYAHARGIIHRDLKPGNILFHADGRVVLADFGLAKILNDSAEVGQQQSSDVTNTGAIIGTPEYFSPEQSTGNPVDKRTDVYSLGIVLYQMLSGHVPFTGSTPVAIAVKHSVEEPPTFSHLQQDIPHGVEAVVMKAIAKKPEQRYSSAGELARALRIAAAEVPSSHPLALDAQRTLVPTTPLTLSSHDTIPEIATAPEPETPTVKATPVPARSEHSSWAPALHLSVTPLKEPITNRKSWLSMWPSILGGLLVLLLIIGTPLALTHIRPAAGGSASTIGGHIQLVQSPTVLPTAPIPVGSLLYGTALPICDAHYSSWTMGNNAHVQCTTSAAELTDTSSSYLAGTFLDRLPDGSTIPNDYILQVQVNESPTSHGSFGVFFRNQPGLTHQGAYSLLLSPNGWWETNVYDNISGKGTLLHRQQATIQFDGLITIDVVVHGNTFTFYLNGQRQGSVQNTLYPNGTIGFAVNVGADIFFRNLAIYNLPNTIP